MRITVEWSPDLMWVFQVPLKTWADFQTKVGIGNNPAAELMQVLDGKAPTSEQIDHAAVAIDKFKKDITLAIANWRVA